METAWAGIRQANGVRRVDSADADSTAAPTIDVGRTSQIGAEDVLQHIYIYIILTASNWDIRLV